MSWHASEPLCPGGVLRTTDFLNPTHISLSSTKPSTRVLSFVSYQVKEIQFCVVKFKLDPSVLTCYISILYFLTPFISVEPHLTEGL